MSEYPIHHKTWSLTTPKGPLVGHSYDLALSLVQRVTTDESRFSHRIPFMSHRVQTRDTETWGRDRTEVVERRVKGKRDEKNEDKP